MSLNGLVPTYLDNNFCLRSNDYNFYILTISERIVADFWIIDSTQCNITGFQKKINIIIVLQ